MFWGSTRDSTTRGNTKGEEEMDKSVGEMVEMERVVVKCKSSDGVAYVKVSNIEYIEAGYGFNKEYARIWLHVKATNGFSPPLYKEYSTKELGQEKALMMAEEEAQRLSKALGFRELSV